MNLFISFDSNDYSARKLLEIWQHQHDMSFIIHKHFSLDLELRLKHRKMALQQ